jgi:hypothetical protein
VGFEYPEVSAKALGSDREKPDTHGIVFEDQVSSVDNRDDVGLDRISKKS